MTSMHYKEKVNMGPSGTTKANAGTTTATATASSSSSSKPQHHHLSRGTSLHNSSHKLPDRSSNWSLNAASTHSAVGVSGDHGGQGHGSNHHHHHHHHSKGRHRRRSPLKSYDGGGNGGGNGGAVTNWMGMSRVRQLLAMIGAALCGGFVALNTASMACVVDHASHVQRHHRQQERTIRQDFLQNKNSHSDTLSKPQPQSTRELQPLGTHDSLIGENRSTVMGLSPVTPLSYLDDPQKVAQIFHECAADPHCHITYHHVSKTGGTTIEEAFFPHFQQPVVGTCCHGRILAKFQADPAFYCRQKFTSWQVSYKKFYKIVDTCHRLDARRRTVVWTTFREPIATFVSLVHQMCNKNLDKRDADKKLACETCEYTNETKRVWLEYAQSVEWQIKGAYRTSHRYLTHPNITSVTMEPNDLNEFWESYSGQKLAVNNAEKKSSCSFRPTSELIKALRPAQEAYRRMLSGKLLSDAFLESNGVLGDDYQFSKELMEQKKRRREAALAQAKAEAAARHARASGGDAGERTTNEAVGIQLEHADNENEEEVDDEDEDEHSNWK